MSSKAQPRDAIVRALDDLGERDNLNYAQRTTADEPYPPSVVSKRLEVLGRSQRLLRIMLGAVVLVGTLLLVSADLGWKLSHSLLGAELLPLIPPVVFGVYRLVYDGKVEQLYELLHRIDGPTETASELPVAEVA